jgi:LysR family glycine cleavage system transcriptional activator
MRTPLPSLIDLEAFEAAARHGSFVGAAGELHLTPSAVSHRVKSLEQQLGVALFTRYARRIELTDHGRSYLPTVRQAFEQVAVSTAALFGWARPSHRLTVRMPISYAVAFVAPRLPEFKAQHPDIELRIVSAIWADALTQDDLDLDIRFGTGHWPGELLHEETATAVWAPSYGDPRTVAALASRPRVHVLGLENLWSGLLGPEAAALTADDVTVDTSLAAIELALTGQFAAVVPSRFVQRQLADGRLRTLPDATAAMAEAHYVVTPASRPAHSPGAAAFVQFLRAAGSP